MPTHQYESKSCEIQIAMKTDNLTAMSVHVMVNVLYTYWESILSTPYSENMPTHLQKFTKV